MYVTGAIAAIEGSAYMVTLLVLIRLYLEWRDDDGGGPLS